ncbi:uncharacterized protein AB675_8247 [Cyphellophora attinorum]|uniref:Annexin A7 n=1 Tax=Cyphellophora attinorum TaxID=1664694 RepID=A0A0N1HWG7_9EURO|nr:uncharacterized protein AB675_8247 [Phialophora attinorum]KPI44527.1 hypothetical protein AB675_8247 [Phialophora attinorum]
MSSHLSVRDERRSRSKSPGGRDRDRSRSHSRDNRDRSPARPDRRSSKYDESESESEESDYDRRRRDKRSGGGGGRYEDDEEDRRRGGSGKKSSRHKDSDSEEDERYKSRSSKSSRRDPSVSDDDRRHDRRRDKKRSDSDDDRKGGGRRERDRDWEREKEKERDRAKHRKKQAYESDSSSSEEEPASRKSKDRKGSQPAVNGYGQPVYGYPPGYGPPNGYPVDPRFAPPPGQYMPPPDAGQRAGSFSGPPPNSRYVPPGYYDDSHRHPEERERERERERPRKDKRYEDDSYDRRSSKDDRRDRDHDRSDGRHDRDRRDRKYHDDSSSPELVTKKLGKLAVGGAAGAATLGVGLGAAQHAMGNGKPPASPLLEAYKGTYQSISPMPSALVLSKHKNDSDLSDFDLDSDDSRDENADLKRKIKKLEQEKERHAKEDRKREGKRDEIMEISPRSTRDDDLHVHSKGPRGRADSDVSTMVITPGGVRNKKKVSFYDADDDAKKIAAALEGTHRPPHVKPLIQILPGLSDDDIMALRLSYKNHAKVGGQGINIAKHIKMRVPGNLGKAATPRLWAAGSPKHTGPTAGTKESLMGRSNSDIREIKNCFKDKRYGDDLERCMKAELKADKFRTAILLALEERRMPESNPLNSKLVMEDCRELYRSLAGAGGESAMISIIVVRSDAHLREVMKAFEKAYEVNFARAMIEKSRNLVGETLAHILNGALNRPMRDALLLHQAIAETQPGKERAELLISRLVRLHWEPKHLERVKQQYENRYGRSVEGAIRKEVLAGMKTEEGRHWSEFCVELAASSA